MVLHWVTLSSAAFIALDLAAKLTHESIASGADPLHLDEIEKIREAQLDPATAQMLRPLPLTRIQAIAPLGSALLQRNTQAIVVLADALARKNAADASAPLLLGERDGLIVSLDAWKLCGHIGIEMPLRPLVDGFGPGSNFCAARHLGAALEYALAIRREDIYQVQSKDTRHLARTFLHFGAEPSQEALRSADIDPAWLVGIASDAENLPSTSGLKTLIRLKFPLDPTDPHVQAPLHIAVATNNPAAMLELLDAGADVTAFDQQGRTVVEALHQSQSDEMVELLRVWMARKYALDAAGSLEAFKIPRMTRKQSK